MPFDRNEVKKKAAELAAKGVYLGTSSWKYEGWLNQLYTPERYVKRKDADQRMFAAFEEDRPKETRKVDEDLFEENCLTEYAEVFKTVCVDAAYYTFPVTEKLVKMADQVPNDFRFAFKITRDLTIKDYPNHPKYGKYAGRTNDNFLNVELLTKAFLKPCEAIRPKVGVLMFEFSRFGRNNYKHSHDFVSDLDTFLAKIPKEWPCGIELRNHDWLGPEYFGCLNKHHVTHVFNSWEHMPPVKEQMARPGSRTCPALVAARFLLKPGRKYDEAVDEFLPYDQVKEPYPEARAAGAALIVEGKAAGPARKTFIYVNNRLEGNALETIDEMLRRVTAQEEAGTFPSPSRRLDQAGPY
ncbi:MAG: DUF72 domain-containing protein [Verrucomicrobiota bacterium]